MDAIGLIPRKQRDLSSPPRLDQELELLSLLSSGGWGGGGKVAGA